MVGERIQLLLDELLKTNRISTKKEFCEILGIDYGSLSKYLSNKVNLSINNLNYSNYKKYNISVEWLLTGEGEMFSRQGEEVPAVQDRIPILRQSVSCGPGQSWEEADIVEGYMEPLSLVPSARGRKVYAFRVRGTSMVGAGIDDGDTIIFDGGSGSDFSDDIYVFALDGSVYCKLVKFDEISRRISIWSVHGEMKDAELLRTLDADSPETADTFHIFGRVLAWVRENRVFRRD